MNFEAASKFTGTTTWRFAGSIPTFEATCTVAVVGAGSMTIKALKAQAVPIDSKPYLRLIPGA